MALSSQPSLARSFTLLVRRLRLSAGLSQDQLAERAGLHPTYIGLLERGERRPSLHVAFTLAAALGMPLSTVVALTERDQTNLPPRRRRGSSQRDSTPHLVPNEIPDADPIPPKRKRQRGHIVRPNQPIPPSESTKMRHRSTLILATSTLAILLGANQTAYAVRPLASVSGTLRASDSFQPLRGVRWSLDLNGSDPVPDTTALTELRTLHGLNTLHVYAARYNEPGCFGSPTCHEAQLLQLVNNAAAANIYLIVTVGWGNPTGADISTFSSFNYSFWDHFVGGTSHSGHVDLKNLSHVILEIQNETWFNAGVAQPYPAWAIDLNANAYHLIRSRGATNRVIIFTYAYFTNPSSQNGVLADISAFSNAVDALPGAITADWSSTVIGFHGYAGAAATEATVIAVRNAGYSVMELELAYSGGCLFQPDLVASHEFTGTGWISFIEPFAGGGCGDWSSGFHSAVEGNGLVWAAEAGTWPALHPTPPADFHLFSPIPTVQKYVRPQATSLNLRAESATTNSSTASWVETVSYGSSPAGNTHRSYKLNYSTGKVKVVNPNTIQGSELPKLRANASSTGYDWELLQLPDGKLVLRYLPTRMFVAADLFYGNPPVLRANRRNVGPPPPNISYERFVLVD